MSSHSFMDKSKELDELLLTVSLVFVVLLQAARADGRPAAGKHSLDLAEYLLVQ